MEQQTLASVWVDTDGLNQQQETLIPAFRDALCQARVVLIVLTPSYLTRPNCVRELRWALDFERAGHLRVALLSMHPAVTFDGRLQLVQSLDALESADPNHVDFVARPLSGFDFVLRAAMQAGSVGSAGDSVLTVTVPPANGFSILAPETVRLTLPAAAVSTLLPSPVSGFVIVNATPGNATLVGGLATTPSEDYIRNTVSGSTRTNGQIGQYVDVVLEDDYWTPLTLLRGLGCTVTTQRSTGTCFMEPEARVRLYAYGDEPNGWNAVVSHLITEASVLNNQTLRMQLPRAESYEITAPEVLHVEVPPLAVLSRQTIHAANALVVSALSGQARLGGTLLFAATVGQLINVSDAYLVVFEAYSPRAVWRAECGIPGTYAGNLIFDQVACQAC